MKICKTLSNFTLLLCTLAFGSGCMPDSLSKWEEPAAAKPAVSSSVTGPDGTPVPVPAPTTGSGPSSFSYSASSFGIKTGEVVSEVPTFIGEPAGITNTYVFSSYDDQNTTTVKSLSTVGLTLDAATGKISGTPSSYAAESVFLIKAYHIPSGITLSATVTIEVATDLTNVTLYYPQEIGTKLILKLDTVTAFSFTPTAGNITSSTGAKGTVQFVDSDKKELYIIVSNTGTNGLGFVATEDVDNATSFVVMEATISSVTYAINTTEVFSLTPRFYSASETISDNERQNFTWSVNPETPTGTNPITFSESVDGVPSLLYGEFNSGTLPTDSLETTEYTVTLHNSIDDIMQVKVRFNISSAPTNLSYNNKVLLTVDSNEFFNMGDTITSNGSGSGVGRVERRFSVTSGTSPNYLVVNVISGEFNTNDSLDNVSPYAASRAIVSSVGMVDTLITLSTAADANNFSIGSGISSNGGATGVVTYKDTTSIKVLTLSTAVTSKWSPGDMIVGNEVAPSTDATGVAQVLYLLSDTQMVVLMISDNFNNGDKVQNRTKYEDPDYTDNLESDAFLGAAPTSLGLLYIRTTSGSFRVGATLTGDAGTSTVANLAADYLTFTVDAATSFKRGYDLTSTFGASGVVDLISGTSISAMAENGFFALPSTVILTVAANTAFSIGDSVCNNNNSFQGVVASKSSTDKLEVSVTTGTIADLTGANDDLDNVCVFMGPTTSVTGSAATTGINIANQNPHAAFAATITNNTLASTLQYNLYRGESAYIRPTLSSGENIAYRLVPDTGYATTLPTGLTLNSSTGVISGTPTGPFATDNFKLEARNSVGDTTQVFNIQVLDSLLLENITTDALSYKLHKTGRSRHTSSCRISSAQLATTGGTAEALASKDIVCFLEAGELDLYNSGMELKAGVGGGMCNFISMRPYQFYQFEYKKSGRHTPKIYYKYTKDAACTGQCTGPAGDVGCGTLVDDTVPTTGLCDGNYTTAANPTYPNCDDGVTTVVTYTLKNIDAVNVNDCVDGDDTGESVTSSAETACGGKRANCINGPAKDMYTVAELEAGGNSTLYAAGTGLTKTWEFLAPISKGHYTNQYLANFEQLNTCSASTYAYHAKSWQTYADGYYYQLKVTDATQFVPGESFSTNGDTFSGRVSARLDATTIIVQGTGVGSLALLEAATNFDNAVPYVGSASTPLASATYTAIYAYDNPFRRGQPYYDINCLNSSYDTIGRIRLIVRDWNRSFSSSSRIDRIQPDSSTDEVADFMDVSGTTLTDPFGNDYNNRADWDNDSSASFEVGSCSATTPPYTETLDPDAVHSFPGAGL